MRKTKPKKRILLPDPKFNDVLVTRFVNDLMVDGKKTVAFKIFYDALDIVEEKMAKKEAIHYLNNFQLQLLILFVQFSTITTICFFCAFLKKLLIPDQVHPSAYLMSFQTEY